MKAKVDLQVRPFSSPTDVYLVADQGEQTVATVNLSALEESTLSALCDQFREEVFAKAGKTDPRLKS